MNRLIFIAGTAAVVAAWPMRRGAAWPLSRYVVRERSMEPAYRPGDRLVVERVSLLWRRLGAGDVVVVRDPEAPGRLLLKRIAIAPGPGAPEPSLYYVLGDNAAESRDSRSFGPVEAGRIAGRVWFRY